MLKISPKLNRGGHRKRTRQMHVGHDSKTSTVASLINLVR